MTKINKLRINKERRLLEIKDGVLLMSRGDKMINKNSIGSEWHKWDLHIHTPDTAKNNQFHSDKDGKDIWEEYIAKLESIDTDVFGITDYFSMNNYLKVKTYQDKGRLKNKFLIPNVEMRIVPVTDSNKSINIHILFNPTLKYEDIEREFFMKMIFEYKGATYHCTRKDLIELGKKYKEKTDNDDVAYKNGIEQFKISYESLNKTLNSIYLRSNMLVGISNGRKDGASGIQDSSMKATREEIYRMSDFIFSSNKQDVMYFLGESSKKNAKDVIDEYGSLKPCINGSDAHRMDEIGRGYTWIKSDPTFEGLRQIIYEPKERVKIDESIPDEKNGYQIIQSISFDDSTIMGKQEIKLNQNLNTIIGGRSSGKSILLGCIAKLVGYSGKIKEDDKYNNYISNLIQGATILWKDGSDNKNRKIEFFGQSRINEIARNQEETNKIILEIIKKNKDKKDVIDFYEQFSNKNKIEIVKKIGELYSDNQNKLNLESELDDKGDKQGIENQINKITEELERIKQNSTDILDDTEQKKYEQLKEQLQQKNYENNSIDVDIKTLNSLKETSINVIRDKNVNELSPKSFKEIIALYDELDSDNKKRWNIRINEIIKKSEKTMDSNNSCMEAIRSNEIYKKGQKFFADNELYSKKDAMLEIERKKAKDVENIEESLKKIEHNIVEAKKEIIKLHLLYYKKLLECQKNIKDEKDEILITMKARFDEEKFKKFVADRFNLKSGEGRNYESFSYTNIDDYRNKLDEIFFKIDSKEIQIKVGISAQQTITELFSENFFSFDYIVNYDGDNISEMSEGKKAFVILRLLLDFDDSNWPILIDQPEDDLDNRTIYEQLVAYIRDKKKKRQIILVTHNPNVVVGADAELVIVANQHGIKNRNQDDLKFEYYAGSLETTQKRNNDEQFILLSQGIREHICDILEGGDQAFLIREKKYGYK